MAIGAAIVVTMLCAGPVLVFLRRLLEVRHDGELQYGALAMRMDRRLRLKYLGAGSGMDQGALDMSDFTGTNAANSIGVNARAVQILPLELRSVGLLMVTTFLPFVPVWLLAVPFDELARKLSAFLLGNGIEHEHASFCNAASTTITLEQARGLRERKLRARRG